MLFVEVSLRDIISYLGNRNKPLIDGERTFRAGHIILCGVDSRNSVNVLIIALCLQTSALTSPPHQINITLNKDIDKWKCECSCKAGKSGFCKHVIAVLIYINRYEQLNEVSCTDLTQTWGKEKKAIKDLYGPLAIQELCHPKQKKKGNRKFLSTEKIDKLNLEQFKKYSQNTALSKFFKRYELLQKSANKTNRLSQNQQLDKICECIRRSQFLSTFKFEEYKLLPCCQEILEKLKSCDPHQTALRCDTQGSRLWKEARQLRITGSRSYAIYTFSNKDGWKKKAVSYFWPKSFTSKFTEYGKKYEKEALQAYKETLKEFDKNSEIYTFSFIICEQLPWLGYSPDGIVFEKGEPTKLLEIKCPFSGKEQPASSFAQTCEYLQLTEAGLKLKEKHQYYGQVQLGMAILNVPSTDFVLYSPTSKSCLQTTVEFNEEFARIFINQISDNYFQYMLHEYCKNKDKYE